MGDREDIRREAGAEAVGILETLLAHGELPAYARYDVQRVVDKFNGTLCPSPQQRQTTKETQ